MIIFTQEFWQKLDTHANKEWDGQVYLTLPIFHIQDFLDWLNNPLEDHEGILRLPRLGDTQLDFSICSIEWQMGEDVFTIKVGDYDFVNDENEND